MTKALPKTQYQVLKYLQSVGRSAPLGELENETRLPHPQVSADCQALEDLGYVSRESSPRLHYRLGPDASGAWAGLPELKVAKVLSQVEDHRLDMSGVASRSGLSGRDLGAAVKYLLSKRWAEKLGRQLVLTATGKEALERGRHADEAVIRYLRAHRAREAGDEEIRREVNGADEGLRLLDGRTGLIVPKERTQWQVSLTDAGKAALGQRIEVPTARRVSLLTSDLLRDSAWRDVKFRPYDVTLESAAVYPGKSHPLRRVMEATRTALLEMGFTEVRSPLVESAFWAFDALFQPQDHPAREMQDTYYVARPAKAALPDDAVVTRVGQTHESGGETGSTGWGYEWKRERAARTTLRTHTTATTVRAVAAHPEPPGRYFTVGLVFRREAADTRHLCAFYQVDGIIIDERGSLASLLGTLRALYTRIGLKNVHFAPDFFPYTEPSVEVRTWLPGDQQWLELCGAGIFRPEVTQPLGCRVPVLAWGGGLERIAMALYGLDDMRALYQMDMDVLRRAALCPR